MALSRPKRGFESRWGRHKLDKPVQQFGGLRFRLPTQAALGLAGDSLLTVSAEGAVATAHPGRLSASVGVHPDSADVQEPTVTQLVELAGTEGIVGIGENPYKY